ncbi:FecR family protein [Achromobacter denitrificans]|uniref:FecR family protein n=1 Tax=Achromobacter denitrificans TaxID=32002 RepID=UPI00078868DF|nr:FecR family protein [Achromobacter denitrificans]MDX3879280.1 FecR family protein [Achromobacter sp.]MBV2162405.1 FecR family protein [Achromobacter denitrificans]OLU06438.1 iron dicitrate transport regulator FecR [Achromobacter denitrificans]QKH40978.1 FecR family protein [Achromobacter denitrificans]QKH51876.1 FecR family protein [Achromobacter denitrificans]
MTDSSSSASPDTLALNEAAAEWLVRRQDASWSAADEQELHAWLAARPAHRQAYSRVARTWEDLSQAPRPALASDAQAASRPSPRLPRRGSRKASVQPGFWGAVLGRPGFSKAFAAVCAALVLGGGYGWYRWDNTPGYVLSVSTAAGEVRRLDLPDGSRVALNFGSTLEVRYYPRRRELVLNQGEGFFDVAPDTGRPFTVDARQSRITVVGTAFNVRNTPEEVIVKVSHGRVRVQPDRDKARPELSLGAEQGVTVDARNATYQAVAAVPDGVGGWRNGRLVYRRTPLGEVAQEVAQYLGKPVTLASPGLKSLPVSGFAATNAPAAFLEALPDLLPVQVKRAPGGGYLIQDR